MVVQTKTYASLYMHAFFSSELQCLPSGDPKTFAANTRIRFLATNSLDISSFVLNQMNFPEGVFDNFLSFSVVCVRWQTDNWCRQDKILGRENNQPSARFGEEHLIHVSEIDCIKLYCSVCGLSRFGCWDSTSLIFNLLLICCRRCFTLI